MADKDEFKAEMPVTQIRHYKTGERVTEEGAFYCENCGKNPPPMVNLEKHQMLPVCPSCGPMSRWRKV